MPLTAFVECTNIGYRLQLQQALQNRPIIAASLFKIPTKFGHAHLSEDQVCLNDSKEIGNVQYSVFAVSRYLVTIVRIALRCVPAVAAGCRHHIDLYGMFDRLSHPSLLQRASAPSF